VETGASVSVARNYTGACQLFLRCGVLSAAQAGRLQNVLCFVNDLILVHCIMFFGLAIHRFPRTVTARVGQSCGVSVSKMRRLSVSPATCPPKRCRKEVPMMPPATRRNTTHAKCRRPRSMIQEPRELRGNCSFSSRCTRRALQTVPVTALALPLLQPRQRHVMTPALLTQVPPRPHLARLLLAAKNPSIVLADRLLFLCTKFTLLFL
jgi:hypothetical protein